MKRKSVLVMIKKAALVLSVMTIMAGCSQKDATGESTPIMTIESVNLIEADGVEVSNETNGTDASNKADGTDVTNKSDGTEVSNETDSTDASNKADETDVTNKADGTEEEKAPEENDSKKDTADEKNDTANEQSGRKDGERFESTIMIEGMEETIKCEHIRNEELGFELDYDYETFGRKKETDFERLVSIYDDAAEPYNYLDVTFRKEEAENVSKTISEELSKEYDISQDSFKLENAGGCIRINASTMKATGDISNLMQVVYIIPTSEGSLIATAHYTFESAEGFGTRMADIVNTLTPIVRK